MESFFWGGWGWGGYMAIAFWIHDITLLRIIVFIAKLNCRVIFSMILKAWSTKKHLYAVGSTRRLQFPTHSDEFGCVFIRTKYNLGSVSSWGLESGNLNFGP